MVFDPGKVTIIWNGRVITGYADGSEINVEHNEDAVSAKTGIQGDTVYANNGNRSGTCKFTLFAESASISALRKDAENRTAGSLTIRNANDDGGFLVSASDCRIVKVPGWTGGKEAKGSEISIYIPTLKFAS